MKRARALMSAYLRGDAGAEDPLAGVISERAWLYSGDERGHTFGPAPDGCIKVHGDGYTTSHAGHCATDSPEPPEEVLIRSAGLDALEAAIVRRRALYEPVAAIAVAVGVSIRTVQRKLVVIRVKAEGYAATVGGMG